MHVSRSPLTLLPRPRRVFRHMSSRFLRTALILALVFGAFWYVQRDTREPASGAGDASAPATAPTPAAVTAPLSTGPTTETAPVVAPPSKLSEWERSVAEMFSASAPSVTYITTEIRRFNAFSGPDVAKGAGSGFVWDGAGHVVTNYHVIEGAHTVYVQIDVGEPIEARVIGGAQDYDIAVVRLSEVPKQLRPLPVGASSTLKVGQSTFAIGNPYGLTRTLTTGVVSALERRLPTAHGREVRGVIQTDASINPGNSGGPLLDSSGRLIGVNTAIYSESGASAGIGFAIPVDLVKRVVPEIIKTGRAPRPGIGIAAADERVAAQLGIKGVVVLGVAPGSPADRAGMRPFRPDSKEPGDVIVGLNGKPVDTLSDFVAALDDIGVGKEVSLTLQRGKSRREIKVPVIDLKD
jgi:2-alkenal reductase